MIKIEPVMNRSH